MKKINLKSTAVAAVLAGTMAFGMVPATAFAATAATVTGDAAGISKTYNVNSKDQWDTQNQFKYTLKYVDYKTNGTDENGNKGAETTFKAGITTPSDYSVQDGVTRTLSTTLEGKTATGNISQAELFSGFSFSTPGVYHFTVQEQNDGNPNIAYDTSVYDVYVNVQNKVDANKTPTGDTEIASITFGKTTGTGDEAKTTKSGDASFTNNTNGNGSLEVSKTVSGTAANTSDVFEFRIHLTNIKGSYTATDSDSSSKNPTTVTAESNGKVDVPIKLKHGESYSIANLPNGATWTVTETNRGSYTGTEVTASTGDAATAKDLKANGTITNSDKDTAAFKNEKGFVPQTGITMNSLAGIAVGVVVVAGAATLVIKRRNKAGEDF